MKLIIHAHDAVQKKQCVPPKGRKKLIQQLLIMKLTFLLIIIFSLQVTANVSAQKVSLATQNQSLESVLKELGLQSGYSFIYDNHYLANAKPVTVTVRNEDIHDVLTEVFAGQPFNYTIKNKVVTLVPRPERKTENRSAEAPTEANLIRAFSEVRGRVVDSLGKPLQGASVRVINADGQRTALQTLTDRNGEFLLQNVPEDALLRISFVGYVTKEINVTTDMGNITLQADASEIEAIEVVVNTGYQSIPKERATGSFTHISNEEINYKAGSTLLERLEGIAPGLQFDRLVGRTQLHIRGLSTFSGSLANNALIILDNFPYEGDINNINPDDIESVTLLSDAAATSIWGARAGNGVLVINTKKPKGNQKTPFLISFRGNTTISQQPDLLAYPQIKSTDFIDLEIDLFNKGHYDSDLAQPDQRLKIYSPVITLLDEARKGAISEQEAYNQINSFRGHEYRQEIMDYTFRNPVSQQYALNISGSGVKSNYVVSAGYTMQHDHVKFSGGGDRFNIRAVNNFIPSPRVKLHSSLAYTTSSDLKNSAYNIGNTIRPGSAFRDLYPYARLMSDEGIPLAVPFQYNPHFVDTAGDGRLLDWTYKPLDIENSSWARKDKNQHIAIVTRIDYELTKGLNLEGTYGFEQQETVNQTHQGLDQFTMRNTINRFTQIKGENLIYPIPLGGLLTVSNANMMSHRVRGQANLNKAIRDKHNIVALLGGEISHRRTISNGFKRYGYNEDTYSVASEIDYVGIYPVFGGLAGNQRLSSGYNGMNDLTLRYVSVFMNGSYTYNQRYIFSFSARQDAGNVFGIKANDRWKPLWSTGIAWNIHTEEFMQSIEWIQNLKFRFTYGHSGNPSSSAATRHILHIRSSGHALYPQLPYAIVNIPANPELKWENIQMTNMAIDFSLFNDKLEGSFEYFWKRSSDIVTSNPLPGVSGRANISANVGNLNGNGFELQLRSATPIGNVSWNKNLSLSFAKNEVTQVFNANLTPSIYIGGNTNTLKPIIGRPLYPIFMYRFEGLDARNGYPIGLLNGEESTDYTAIIRESKVEDAQFEGTGLPPYHGFFRNSFSYKNVDLSFNITYKFGHVFARETFTGSITAWDSHSDYYRRWQKPGDEEHTNIPAYAYPTVSNLMSFYQRSSAVIEKGDVIRLQDIRVGYQLQLPMSASIKPRIQIFAQAANVALLWKASKAVVDPEFPVPPLRTFSFGFSANL